MKDHKAGAETPAVLLLDPQKLRREGIAKLLAPWCNQNCLGLTAAGPTGLPFEFGAKLDYCLVLINVGSQRIDHRDPADCIDRVLSLLPSTPVIILSDSDAPTEVVAAFQAGASAFIPTAMEPTLAMEVLKFVMRGGTYFPPAAIAVRSSAEGHPPISGTGREGLPLSIGNTRYTTSCEKVSRTSR